MGSYFKPTEARLISVCNWTKIVFGAVYFTALAVLTPLSSARAEPEHPGRDSNLELRSSDARLVAAFDWAKRQAMSYVFDGDPVGPWYEAALPGRRAFCMRDVSHQAAGAQALGLAEYTHNMLHRFAENISASRDWCSYWEINYMNQPAPVDYKNDAEFWYNLPANFDVLDACYRMFLLTGDATYIDDPAFLNFYGRTVTDYVSRWDLGVNRIMTRTNMGAGTTYFRGDPSYEESRRDLLLGVDLLATQYAGYRSFAAIQAIRGDKGAARAYLASAVDIKRLINTTWWNSHEGYFYAFLDRGGEFRGRAGVDLLYRDVADDGPKVRSALHSLMEQMRSEPAGAVEPASHFAEILYRYGEPNSAYTEIMDLSRTGRDRQEYPEVSFSVIGAIVNGLVGIEVEPAVPIEDVAQGKQFAIVIKTLPQLTSKTSWVEVRNVPIRSGAVSVRHEGNTATKFTNKGTTEVTWEAAFPGSFFSLIQDGRSVEAHVESGHLGHEVSWIRVAVKGGTSARVVAPH